MTLPIYFERKLVSLNKYRNNHWRKNHKEKKYFHGLISKNLNKKVKVKKFKLEISLYPKQLGCDGGNICALIEKYYLDALKENGVIADDNLNNHIGTTWKFEKQDKVEPRVEVKIIEVIEEKINDKQGELF